MKIGTRVTAISHTKDNKVYIFGYGKYLGEKPCELLGGIKNPCIELDNGKLIYGCQCWWGETNRVQDEIIKDKEIILIE